MDLEAGVERRRETHRIDGLIHRFLDEERCHRRQLGDAAGELDGVVRQFVVGKDLAHHADGVGFVGAERVAGEQKFLRLSRPELPGMAEVLHPAHAEPGADDVGEDSVLARDDEVAAPRQHQARGEDRSVDLGDGDLAEIAPSLGVLEEVVPLLPVA